jgi:hypothetical protein
MHEPPRPAQLALPAWDRLVILAQVAPLQAAPTRVGEWTARLNGPSASSSRRPASDPSCAARRPTHLRVHGYAAGRPPDA